MVIYDWDETGVSVTPEVAKIVYNLKIAGLIKEIAWMEAGHSGDIPHKPIGWISDQFNKEAIKKFIRDAI